MAERGDQRGAVRGPKMISFCPDVLNEHPDFCAHGPGLQTHQGVGVVHIGKKPFQDIAGPDFQA